MHTRSARQRPTTDRSSTLLRRPTLQLFEETSALPERGATNGSTALPAPQPAVAHDFEMEQVALPAAAAPAAAAEG